MGGFPVVFIGYELEDDALDIYQSSSRPREATKSLLRVVESETSRPASIVRYDSKGQGPNTPIRLLLCGSQRSDLLYERN